MRVSVSERATDQISADTFIVVFRAPRRGRLQPALAEHLHEDAGRLIARRAETVTWLETRGLATPRVLFYCLGPEPGAWAPQLEYLGGHAGSFDRATEAQILRRTLRNAGAQIERVCNQAGVRHAVLASWPDGCDPITIVEGMYLRAHDPRAWERRGHGPPATSLRKLGVCLGDRTQAGLLRDHLKILDATNFARELGDLPSNVGSASQIVERVEARVREAKVGLRLSTIPASEAEAIGMGLFTAVDAGAATRGCILRLDHRPDDPGAPLVFVGKGLTHDTGGYNLKTSPTIHQLTHDKCGATAVIGAKLATASLDVPLRVIGLCPLTENAIDANAYKPGDVLRAYDGTTVYIENTDAEGRLVLADVLAWLRELEPRPELVIDLATLTGAMHTALGEPYAGLFCNEDRARELLVSAGRRTGDLVWPMPIHEIHDRDLGHHKADLRNIGVAGGAPSSAAAFLRSFVDYPWAHVDLAGKSHAEFARESYGPGATGFGCRLLVACARELAGQRHA